jgi:MurNAc alpha-1-phosphate uridylyltransferase
MLERCINLIEKLGIKKILINTFYLKDQFLVFLNSKNFNVDIKIIEDGERILDTGGGIQNMIKDSNEKDFLIFNPDTIWSNDYKDEILKMEKMYFSEKLENILLLANKKLSFDKKLKGDFNLKNNLINKEAEKEFIYIGCQIINKKLFIKEKIENYSILEIWNNLLDQKKLFGYESRRDFYHLTDLDIFKKLKDL